MQISKKSLKNGVEVDLPMMKNEIQTSKAIRYLNGIYQVYNFQTKENIYSASTLESVIEYTNRKYKLNDIAI